MATVVISCSPNPAADQVTKYNFYDTALLLGNSTNLTAPSLTVLNVAAGSHVYSVRAVNVIGEGPASDPYTINIPVAVPGKCVNVTVNVTIS